LRAGKHCGVTSANCLAKSFALAIPYSHASSSDPSFATATVIVMNSFGPSSSAQIVTSRLLRLVAFRSPTFARVIFISASLRSQPVVTTSEAIAPTFMGHKGSRSPNSRRPVSHRGYIATFQVFDFDHAVRILAFEETRGLHRVVLSVAVGARRAVYSNFKLSACHCG
jgi:hypothetical protein